MIILEKKQGVGLESHCQGPSTVVYSRSEIDTQVRATTADN